MNSRLRAAAPPPVGLRRRSSRPGGDGAVTLAPTRLPPAGWKDGGLEGWQVAGAGWGTDEGRWVAAQPP